MRYQVDIRVPQPQSTQALALSPDGSCVATTCFDQKLRAYSAELMIETKKVHLGTAFPHAACFSPDGRYVASGGKALTLFDTVTWKKAVTLKGHRHEIQRAVFSPDGRAVYTGSGNSYTPADWSVRSWDAATGTEQWRWKGPDQVFALDASPDGTMVVAATTNGQVVLLDAATGGVRRSVSGDGWPYRARFTPDGSSVVLSGDADTLSVLDVASGAMRSIPNGGARCFAITRDGTRAFVGQCRSGVSHVLVVEISTGGVLWKSDALGYLPQGLEISPDERRIYVLMYDPQELLVFERE